MVRRDARPAASSHRLLEPQHQTCWVCTGPLWVAYHSHRTVATVEGVVAFTLVVRTCRTLTCARYRQPYRPEEEGAVALPQAECGLDVIALVGSLRYSQHRSVPEIHEALGARGVRI